MLYLDNSATSIRKPAVVYRSFFYNTLFNSANAGRGAHKPSLRALEGVLNAQEAAARLFKSDNPMNIAFTYNATYALNMAILGAAGNGHVVATQMDHNSVLRPIFKLGNFSIADADKRGYVTPEAVKSVMRPDTRLVICTHASNVCGTIQPVKEIARIAHRRGALFLLDAAQTAGCVDIDAKEIDADFIAFSGHKGLMGPLGTGGLYVRNPSLIHPVITGGTGSQSENMRHPSSMPDMLHAGSVNAPGIAALGAAINFVLRRGIKEIWEREREMANRLHGELMNMDNISVYGSFNRTGTVAFNINNLGSEETAALIGKEAIVRAGYHCAPLAHSALGTQTVGAVRASFGFYNTMRDVKKFTDIVYRASRGTK